MNFNFSPDFKKFSNDSLHDETVKAAKQEKRATFELLEFLVEVDERRLYGERGYSSLWEYVHKALGYSESQASERVATMRLMQKVPEVKVKISEDKVTLTAAAKLASFVRRENCKPETTLSLLGAISEKSTREAERILASEQTEPVTRPDLFRPAGSQTTRIAFDADSEFMELFEELKNLQGLSKVSICERLKAALKTEVARKRDFKARVRTKSAASGTKKNPQNETFSQSKTSDDSNDRPLRAPEVKARTRFYPVELKRAIRARSGNRCEFVDRKSGRRCECRFGLQFDHIRPFAMGGESTVENMRHLCANHNRLAAVHAFGMEKMAAHFARG